MCSVESLVAAIEARTDLPLSSAQVFAQQEHYYPSTWKSKWPTGPSKPAVVEHADERKKTAITRRDVFDAAKDVASESDAIELYVKMCGWGAGVQGRTVFRALRPLAQPDVGAKLLRSHTEIRAGGDPVEVYSSLSSGENRVKFFGPAFFTKWLYFSAYDSPGTKQLRPLILDARVARTLGWSTWGWRASTYGRYLELAHAVADGLGTTEPHIVEHALFTMNGKLQQ